MASSSDRLPSCNLQNYILADVIMITRAYIRMHYASLRWPRITSSKWRSGPPVDAMEETGVPTGTG